MKGLLLIGCGGHARSLIELIESAGQWEIQGLVGLPSQLGREILGYRVIGSDDDLKSLRFKCESAVLAVGQLTSPSIRQRLADQLDYYKFQCPVLKSPNSVVSRHATLGRGTTIGHGVVVNAGATVGDHCILNTHAVIEHDTQIGSHCHVSTGVRMEA